MNINIKHVCKLKKINIISLRCNWASWNLLAIVAHVYIVETLAAFAGSIEETYLPKQQIDNSLKVV